MSSYKFSRFNHIIPTATDVVIFNAFSTKMCIIPKHEYKKMEHMSLTKIETSNKPYFDKLRANGSIIDSSMNERDILRNRVESDKNNTSHLSFTIAPTMGCNFDCPYCFESKKARSDFSTMSSQTQTHIYKLMKLHKPKTFSVVWFGGEPLLALNTIMSLSDTFISYSTKHNVSYSSTIITNGFLLSSDVAKQLVKAHINHIQITIDGDQTAHDRTRVLKNGKGSYKKILSNLEALSAFDFNVSLRINVDQHNKDSIYNLCEDLKNLKLPNKLSIYPEHIHIDPSNHDQKANPLQSNDYYNKHLEILTTLKKYSFYSFQPPKLACSTCSANHKYSYMIGPKGELYTCWEDFGDPAKVIGHLNSSVIMNQSYIDQYMTFNPVDDPKCGSCTVMPLCMGGCAKERLIKNEPQCKDWKYNLSHNIINHLQQQSH